MQFPTIKRKAKRIPTEQRIPAQPEPICQNGFGTEMPPQKRLVEIYFDQKEIGAQAETFFDHYEKANWRSRKGTPFRNWKLLAAEWIFNYEQEKKLQKRQRDNALYKMAN
ncbi:hypothetical protein [Mucilaginibacter myungsuensis]|uniref:Uncharacterized protein n=1 Tax=Mucilaginibacter myungsuensis TaxID=649104 RepID=A0A929PY90_9SPHI|nr:hypothetical protein [Mucilaginibacter myungsuensis]MBE9663200.1 hypothetical protein [Mucilaginibacter myungsuensis]MDN3598833.1 hypothetical protein [Mucilaginibacter myungsuensis]